MPANLVFHLKIWGARDNGKQPRSTPAMSEMPLLTYVPISVRTRALVYYFQECQSAVDLALRKRAYPVACNCLALSNVC